MRQARHIHRQLARLGHIDDDARLLQRRQQMLRLRLIGANQEHARRTDNLAKSAQLIILVKIVILAGHDDLRREIEEAAVFARLRQAEARVARLQIERFLVDQSAAGEYQQVGRGRLFRMDPHRNIETLILGNAPRRIQRRYPHIGLRLAKEGHITDLDAGNGGPLRPRDGIALRRLAIAQQDHAARRIRREHRQTRLDRVGDIGAGAQRNRREAFNLPRHTEVSFGHGIVAEEHRRPLIIRLFGADRLADEFQLQIFAPAAHAVGGVNQEDHRQSIDRLHILQARQCQDEQVTTIKRCAEANC